MGVLDGKVAIVTGAGIGIGRAEAISLAEEGAKIVDNDLGSELDGSGNDQSVAQKVADEINSSGGEAVANIESVADYEAASRMINQAVDTFGRLDILVNNAGITRDKILYKMDEEMFDSVVAVHLKGTFNTCKWACKYFREKNEGGRIINTTSAAGLAGTFGQSNYSAAKAGIAVMTLIISQEMAKYNVKANAIAPAARTRMTVAAFGEMTDDKDGEFDRLAPENIAPFVVYLASDASENITGQVFGISAGDIELYQPWTTREKFSKTGRWTVEEIKENMKEYF